MRSCNLFVQRSIARRVVRDRGITHLWLFPSRGSRFLSNLRARAARCTLRRPACVIHRAERAIDAAGASPFAHRGRGRSTILPVAFTVSERSTRATKRRLTWVSRWILFRFVFMRSTGPSTKRTSSAWNTESELRWRPTVGIVMCACACAMHGYLTLAVIGAFTPETYSTGWTGVDNALRDDLARSALPTLIPGTIAFVYFNWLAARFFEHT